MNMDGRDDIQAIVYLSDKIHFIQAILTQNALVSFHRYSSLVLALPLLIHFPFFSYREFHKQVGWLKGSGIVLQQFALVIDEETKNVFYLVDSFKQLGTVGMERIGNPKSINDVMSISLKSKQQVSLCFKRFSYQSILTPLII